VSGRQYLSPQIIANNPCRFVGPEKGCQYHLAYRPIFRYPVLQGMDQEDLDP